jgi:hypothetical protein
MIAAKIEDIDIDAVYERLFKLMDVTSNRALSIAIGVSVSNVTSARSRQTLPWEAVILTSKKHGFSLDELFDVDVKQQAGSKQVTASQPDFTLDKLLAANQLVEDIFNEVLPSKLLSPERESFVCKQLRPILLKALFENDFNRTVVKVIAEGALAIQQ